THSMSACRLNFHSRPTLRPGTSPSRSTLLKVFTETPRKAAAPSMLRISRSGMGLGVVLRSRMVISVAPRGRPPAADLLPDVGDHLRPPRGRPQHPCPAPTRSPLS